jgi:hypothetical protein
MHSRRYKTPEIFRGMRVLVVGAGNSGCDIAVDASEHASRTFLSVRRGYHFIPKHVLGRPIDQVGELSLKLRLPLSVRRALNELVLRAVVGRPEDYGLPRPDHRLLETHPIVNSRILPAIRGGDLRPRPDVVELRGREVAFKDGTSEPIDLIVFATGYQVTFPFLERRHLNDLYLHVFHPIYDDLFILGMIQPDSGVWPLMDLQAKAVASYIGAGDGPGVRRGTRAETGTAARSERRHPVREIGAAPVRGGALDLRAAAAQGDSAPRALKLGAQAVRPNTVKTISSAAANTTSPDNPQYSRPSARYLARTTRAAL